MTEFGKAGTAISRQVRQQQTREQSNSNAVADVYTLVGRFQVDGLGESVRDVTFPVNFSDIPNFSFGFELSPGHAVVDNAFPTLSMCVLRWASTTDDLTSGRAAQLFTGCTFGVVVTGQVGQKVWVHWRMEGTALSTPIHGSQTAGGYA
jgi:hypothetical protein